MLRVMRQCVKIVLQTIDEIPCFIRVCVCVYMKDDWHEIDVKIHFTKVILFKLIFRELIK